jgi:hypothetical protein
MKFADRNEIWIQFERCLEANLCFTLLHCLFESELFYMRRYDELSFSSRTKLFLVSENIKLCLLRLWNQKDSYDQSSGTKNIV